MAPACKKCLRALDRLFPAPEVAPTVFLLAQLAADQVVEHGSAEIHGVPADQVEALRKHAKKVVRQRGFSCRTMARDDLVLVYSDEAYQAIPSDVRLARDRAISDRMGSVLEGREPEPLETPWRLRWSTWDA